MSIEPMVHGLDTRLDNSALRLTGVSKRFGGVAALKDVTFEVHPGEIHALLGENGAGKSTLMAVAAGSLRPDRGAITLGGNVHEAVTPALARASGLAIVYQHPALVPDLTVMENVTMAMPERLHELGSEAADWVRSQLERLGCTAPLAARVDSLDVVQRQLLEITKALAADPAVLILDEPTAVLGADETDRLFSELRRLSSGPTAVVYITHRLAEVRELCGRVTVLRDGEVRGTLDVAATADAEILRLIVGRDLEATFPAKRSAGSAGAKVLEARGLHSTTLQDVSLVARAGEIVGIGGIVGNGQSEVLRAFGGLEHIEGMVEIGGRAMPLNNPPAAVSAGVVYLSADRLGEGLFGSMSVRENTTIASLGQMMKWGFISHKAETMAVERQREVLNIRTASVEANVLSLSGGNQQKVLLSRALARNDVKVILADEPTQGVDVGARVEIYRILREAANRGVAVLVVSSDVQELEGLCDRVVVMSSGRVVAELSGTDVTEGQITNAAITSTLRRDQRTGRVPSGMRLLAGLKGRMVGTYGASAILAVAVIVVAAYTQVDNSHYLSSFNLTSLTFLIASLAFVSLGEACVMLTGGIDLSVGPLAGFVVVIGSFMEGAGHGGLQAAGFVVMLAAGATVGLINGVLVQIAGFTPVAATLITYIGLQGLSLVLRPFQAGYIATPIINGLSSNAGPIAVAFIAVIVVTVIAEYCLRRRMWGLKLRAYGSKADAAYRLGVRPNRTVIGAYVASGLLASVGGILLMAQVGVGDPTQGVSYTLAAVTAVVLGGTSIFGGKGTFIGALFGAVLVEQLLDITGFLHLSQAWQYWFQGALIFIAVGIYTRAGASSDSRGRRLLRLRQKVTSA